MLNEESQVRNVVRGSELIGKQRDCQCVPWIAGGRIGLSRFIRIRLVRYWYRHDVAVDEISYGVALSRKDGSSHGTEV